MSLMLFDCSGLSHRMWWSVEPDRRYRWRSVRSSLLPSAGSTSSLLSFPLVRWSRRQVVRPLPSFLLLLLLLPLLLLLLLSVFPHSSCSSSYFSFSSPSFSSSGPSSLLLFFLKLINCCTTGGWGLAHGKYFFNSIGVSWFLPCSLSSVHRGATFLIISSVHSFRLKGWSKVDSELTDLWSANLCWEVHAG